MLRLNATRHLVVTAAVAALGLTACGDDSGTTQTDSASRHHHNDADVSFAQDMIEHHRQAIEMAELAQTRASSGEVKDLAEEIEKAQDPEITTMTGWLESWGEEVPEDDTASDESASDDSDSGMDHGDQGHGSDSESDSESDSDMPGMMSDEQMTELEDAAGEEFDALFLEMMIEHHEGAVEMARTETKKGAYGPAIDLASDVVDAQTREISEMEKLLNES